VTAPQISLEDIKSQDVPVDEAQYPKPSAAEPKKSATLLSARIDELVQPHPVAEADDISSLPSGVVVIGDLAKWKSTLELSPAPIPYSGPDVEQDSEGTVSPKL
jgi:hypothetical protein